MLPFWKLIKKFIAIAIVPVKVEIKLLALGLSLVESELIDILLAAIVLNPSL